MPRSGNPKEQTQTRPLKKITEVDKQYSSFLLLFMNVCSWGLADLHYKCQQYYKKKKRKISSKSEFAHFNTVPCQSHFVFETCITIMRFRHVKVA